MRVEVRDLSARVEPEDHAGLAAGRLRAHPSLIRHVDMPTRPIGALLPELNHEWQLQRRCMQLE